MRSPSASEGLGEGAVLANRRTHSYRGHWHPCRFALLNIRKQIAYAFYLQTTKQNNMSCGEIYRVEPSHTASHHTIPSYKPRSGHSMRHGDLTGTRAHSHTHARTHTRSSLSNRSYLLGCCSCEKERYSSSWALPPPRADGSAAAQLSS